MALNYCDEDIGEHTEIECQQYLPGGVSAIIIVTKGNLIADASDATEINAAIADGFAKVILGVTFDIPRGSDITQTNPVACGEDLVVNRTNTVNLFDANVSPENGEFYDSLDGKNIAQIIAFDCETDYVTNIAPRGPISFSVGFVSPPTNGEFQRYESTGTFKGKGVIKKVTKPLGITGIDA